MKYITLEALQTVVSFTFLPSVKNAAAIVAVVLKFEG